MNNIVRAAIEIPAGVIKAAANNLMHGAHISLISAINPFAEVTIDRGAKAVIIGPHFRARWGAHIRVRKGAALNIGKNVSINHGCMIVCRGSITIGNDVQFSPNVMLYDHDHDYRADGGVKGMGYKTAAISIGSNVWIGANSVILRGTTIGDGCVIAAGSVVKGKIPEGSLYFNRKEETVKNYGGCLNRWTAN